MQSFEEKEKSSKAYQAIWQDFGFDKIDKVKAWDGTKKCWQINPSTYNFKCQMTVEMCNLNFQNWTHFGKDWVPDLNT